MSGLRTLHLVLKYKWYDLIERGEKLWEYRDKKPIWKKKIWDECPVIIVFHRGYTSTTMSWLVDHIEDRPHMYAIRLSCRVDED